MEYETFLNEVKEQMEHALGKGYDLTLRRVPKNNGPMLDGLCIAKSGGHVAPAIYLNPCYLQHQAGRPIGDIVSELMTLYQDNQTPPDVDYEKLACFEEIRPFIACRLIHADSNQALLKEIPHIAWLDLALVFYLCLHEDDSGLMTATIHNLHLDIWNISLTELKETALANTPRLFPPVISSMARIIEDLSEAMEQEPASQPFGNQPGDHGLPDPDASAPFFVLSNTSGINGAACILYPGVLKNFADSMEKDIIILPSSIHEVLLLPDDGDISYNEMSRLVAHINQTEVPKEDRLSNQVYFYSRQNQSLTLASSSAIPIC